MRIHQFVHTLTYGDAISDEARSIQRLLREQGMESEIYSAHWHTMFDKPASEVSGSAGPRCEGKAIVRHYRSFPEALQNTPKGEETVLLLHYSIGSPLNDLYLSTQGVRKALIYHNLTPEHWFESYNPRVTADLRKGRDEFPKIIAATDLCLADSQYNELDLKKFGAKETRVLPLLVDLSKWSVAPNPGIAQAVRARGTSNIVHVGRFAPNKCLQDIIKGFYFFHHKIDKNSHLWLPGSEVDTELYSFELRSLVKELRLQEAVTFPGSLADSELKAIYENSALYVCMSEHEGFCVPLIEAMHFGLPVIAFQSSAVGETLGDGGLLISRKSPAELAEAMNLAIHDPQVRSHLQRQGRKRVESFSQEVFRKNLQVQLIEPLQRTSRGNVPTQGSQILASA